MIVLDTNVLSELMRHRPDESVIGWMEKHAEEEFLLTAITVAEILHGVARLPEGKRKAALGDTVAVMLAEDFSDAILAFDEQAASHYAELVSARERAGRPISMADAQIAAICLCHNAILVTRNVKDFDGMDIELINPWERIDQPHT